MVLLGDVCLESGASFCSTSLHTGSINFRNVSRLDSVVNFRLTARTNACCSESFTVATFVEERAADDDRNFVRLPAK